MFKSKCIVTINSKSWRCLPEASDQRHFCPVKKIARDVGPGTTWKDFKAKQVRDIALGLVVENDCFCFDAAAAVAASWDNWCMPSSSFHSSLFISFIDTEHDIFKVTSSKQERQGWNNTDSWAMTFLSFRFSCSSHHGS